MTFIKKGARDDYHFPRVYDCRASLINVLPGMTCKETEKAWGVHDANSLNLFTGDFEH